MSSGVGEGTKGGCPGRVRTYWGRSYVAEGHHRGRRPPAHEAGVPPAGTSVRRAQRTVYTRKTKNVLRKHG